MKATVINLINFGDRYLRRAGLITHRLSTERLMEYVLRKSGAVRTSGAVPSAENHSAYGIAGVYLDRSLEVSREMRKKFFALLRERAKRFPLQYLLGEASFMDFSFTVDRTCLIPRPETEFLVEQVIREIKETVPSGEVRIIDIGTGCGNIALSLTRYLPFAEVWATDISEETLALAKKNAVKLGVWGKERFVLSNLFQNVPDLRFECIVSNPPYLSRADMKMLEGEVMHEPSRALFGGKTGTETIITIAHDARKYLTNGGLLAMEIGMGQAKKVKAALKRLGYSSIRTMADYVGIQRVVLARYCKARRSL